MIIVDTALERLESEGRHIRVALVGAGFMGAGIALQLLTVARGMRLVAVVNRNVEKARLICAKAGFDTCEVASIDALEQVVAQQGIAVTDDPTLVCAAGNIDVVIEATGAVEYGAHVAMAAITHGKHVVLMNAELDGTIGPILKVYADRQGVILTSCDGDQPGETMNLYRFVRGIGVKPIMCGNIKGLHDPHRNPSTQMEFARRWGQNPHMVASFADGTKISFEQALVANATGMRVAKRGMYGPDKRGEAVDEAPNWFPLNAMMEGPGIVDYVVGALPAPGVFVLGTCDHPVQKRYLHLYKLGSGPIYVFYTPYHLCHFEVPNTIARAVIFRDAALAPLAGPVVDVVTTAKVDLVPGDLIDGFGGYKTYGLAENHDVTQHQRLLPAGLAEGCRLRRPVRRDEVVTYDDVDIPRHRLCDRLRMEQNICFASAPSPNGTDLGTLKHTA